MSARVSSGRPGVVAITLHQRGGGIAALSRLLVDALRVSTSRDVPSFTLTERPRGGSFRTSFAERVAFGARVALAQATGRCDWLFFTHLSLATVQRYVPALGRVPYAVFLHDVEAWEPLPPARTAVLKGAFLRVANSDFTARRVTLANPDVGPVVACPLALSQAEAAAIAAAPPARRSSHDVLIVGRMVASERYKGHDQLIDIWPAVRANVPDARLICVGEGDDVARLEAKARRLGVADAVQFTGFISAEERRAKYRQSALLAMPSRREGFGLVYLEAMASGLPCLGSIHDAAAGVIVDGVTGTLVDQRDHAAMADHIVSLLSHEDVRQAMGDAGRRRFLQHYTFEAFASRLNSCLAGAGHGATGAAPESVRETGA